MDELIFNMRTNLIAWLLAHSNKNTVSHVELAAWCMGIFNVSLYNLVPLNYTPANGELLSLVFTNITWHCSLEDAMEYTRLICKLTYLEQLRVVEILKEYYKWQ